MGAQRSGTTLLSRIFDDLYYADVYGEFSRLSSQDKFGLRLNSPESVNATLEKSRANLIVMKPLVESQRADQWLKNIPKSKIVWIYRNYGDVAASSVVKFGETEGGVSHIRAFVDPQFAKRDCAIWKSENASPDTVSKMQSFYRDDMCPHDAAAFFWYARNVLYLEQNLYNRPDTMLIRYEDLVRYPFLVISYILQQFKIFELKSATISSIGTGSVGKGRSLNLSTDANRLCEGLLQELDNKYNHSPLGKMLQALPVTE